MRTKYYALAVHRGTRRWANAGTLDGKRCYETEAEARDAAMRYIAAYCMSEKPVTAWRVLSVNQTIIAAGGV